jgi:hypothetical protein
MIEWFAYHKDVIAGIAGVATAIGLVVTSLALVVATVQIRQQRQLNRAHTVYDMQRDARELAWQLMSDPILAHAVFGDVPDKGKAAIASAINYYSAVFQMWQHKVLSDHLWNLFATDFAKMLELDRSRLQWDATKASFDRRFVDDMEARITRRRTQ